MLKKNGCNRKVRHTCTLHSIYFIAVPIYDDVGSHQNKTPLQSPELTSLSLLSSSSLYEMINVSLSGPSAAASWMMNRPYAHRPTVTLGVCCQGRHSNDRDREYIDDLDLYEETSVVVKTKTSSNCSRVVSRPRRVNKNNNTHSWYNVYRSCRDG